MKWKNICTDEPQEWVGLYSSFIKELSLGPAGISGDIVNCKLQIFEPKKCYILKRVSLISQIPYLIKWWSVRF
jgi:hypothetical protein